MKSIIVKVFALLICSLSLGSIENSIIPSIEYFESLENIPMRKFSQNHFEKISRALERKNEKIRVVTYNMLFDFYDFKMENKENTWPNRLQRVLEILDSMKPDVIATQELYPKQVEDLKKYLANDFSFFPGYTNRWGESYGIFYRTKRFEMILGESDSPLSLLTLMDKNSQKSFTVVNTHLAFSNVEKREKQAKKIVKLLQNQVKKGPLIFTGDLNTFTTRLELDRLPFYDGDEIHRILAKAPISNAKERSLLGHFGPIATFTDDGSSDPTPFKGKGTPGVILDYIYTTEDITVLAHGTECATVDGHFPSDHMPVIADLLLENR